MLIIITNISSSPTSSGDVGSILIQGSRLSMFIILCFLYFGSLGENIGHTGNDPERQSLLRKLFPSNAANSRQTMGGNAYGRDAIHARGQDSDPTKDDESVSDNEWLKRQRQGKEKFLKRLKQDGNWLSYVKGFSVSRQQPHASVYRADICFFLLVYRYSFHMCGLCATGVSNLELSLLQLVC